MDQGMFDPTGRNIAGDFAVEAKQELDGKLNSVFDALLECSYEDSVSAVKDAFESYYRSLKLPVDEDVLSAKLEELRSAYILDLIIAGKDPRPEFPDDSGFIDEYSSLFQDLKVIGSSARQAGYGYTISRCPSSSFNFGWDCEKVPFWLNLNMDRKNNVLCALPLCDMETSMYGPYFIGGVPPAADIVCVTPNMILLSDGFSDDFLNALVPDKEEVEIPCCSAYKQGFLLLVELTDPACVSAPASPCEEEVLDYAREVDGISLVSVVTSGLPLRKVFRI